MNFLELCQRLCLEAGISGTGPTTVVDQAGEYEKVVSWISSAYEDIQNTNNMWNFLRHNFTFSTILGVQDYTTASVSLPELATWQTGSEDFTVYLTTSDEQYLTYISWNDFKSIYLFGSNRDQTGRPTVITVKPDRSVSLWPTPDDIYTITGEYFKKAQTMVANTSSPIIPSQFHMLIVWRALMFYGAFMAANEKYEHGQNEYGKLLRKLSISELPKMKFGRPLV